MTLTGGSRVRASSEPDGNQTLWLSCNCCARNPGLCINLRPKVVGRNFDSNQQHQLVVP